MQAIRGYQYVRRDITPVTAARRSELAAGYAENQRLGNAPYAGVPIRTLGELDWIMAERGWSGRPKSRGRERADLRDADLRGAQLQEVALFAADLRHADCTGICLQRAVLRWANCQETNLRGGDLCAAHLFGAHLHGADFRGTQLMGADLQGTDLSAAHFADADLHGASLRWADMDADALHRLNVQEADVFGVNTYRQAHRESVHAIAGGKA